MPATESGTPEPVEIPLSTSGVTHVVRVGDTVRRTWRPSTPTVHLFLEHLHQQGVPVIPRPLGRDEHGREVLSFVSGDVPVRPLPTWATSETSLTDVAQLLRRLHDAAQEWTPPPGAAFGHLPGAPAPSPGTASDAEVVAHGDYCPGNVVFRNQRPAGFIDFDLIKPTTRVADCVNALHWWVPLIDPVDRQEDLRDIDVATRIAAFAAAYDMTPEQRSAIARSAVERAERSLAWAQRAAALDPVFTRWWEGGWKDEMPRTVAWLSGQRNLLEAALRRVG